MASYTVPNGGVGVHEKALAADVQDVVTFAVGTAQTPGWGRVPTRVEILTDGAADIYVTTGGANATVRGGDCWRIPALPGATVIDVRDAVPDDPVVIKLISSGTPVYSVSRAA